MMKIHKILSFFYLIAILCNPIIFVQKTLGNTGSSVLASGKWFRIAVTTDGIYRIDYAKLRQLGIDDPSAPRIFGNNCGQLSYYNDDKKPDDLIEQPIYYNSGSDGIFSEGDYLLFYAKGTHRWIFNYSTGEYDFLRHNYSDTAYYFITSGTGTGNKITTLTEPAASENFYSSESDDLFIHELENVNLIKSGREWFQTISSATPLKIDPGFNQLSISGKIKYRIRVASRASVNTSFQYYEGSLLRKNLPLSGVSLQNSVGTYAQITSDTGSFIPASGSPLFEIRFNNNGEFSAKGWIDYLQLQSRKSNVYSGRTLQIMDSRTISAGKITLFTVKSLPGDAFIWDISDPMNIREIQYTRSGENVDFRVQTDSLRTFLAFSPSDALIPLISFVPIANQDLHSSEPADMIIISHQLFRTYADKLAEIHFNNSGLITDVVTIQQVYNEFSGGVPDIAAIRNFLRMKYLKQHGTAHPLKYVLLFGDGSYENKTLPPGNPNYIPTYQSQNSNVFVASFTSDDFYGLLGNGEGEAEGTEDIGIGRLPVSDTASAGILISKIQKYLDPTVMGDWRNIICMTADDEDGNIHMTDAEGLSSIIQTKYPYFNLEKIYLDAYKQSTSVTGQSYPDVNKAISDRINAGCLIFNYVGHGNELGLAVENIIDDKEIAAWQNTGKLPLFITATCEFSRFDDIEIDMMTKKITGVNSAGEKVLLRKDGGGIALMSTTRLVYSAPNYFLNRNIFNCAFERDSSGNSMRLGDIIRIAKNNSGNGSNKRNFTLLGDPALKLSYPWHGTVVTDSVYNAASQGETDSLKALSVITVSGHVEDRDGKFLSGLDGIVSPLVFDKPDSAKTLANDGGPVMEFTKQNNILFSGKTSIKDGLFRFSFIVPRDIDYSYGNGKISYYADNGTVDMTGSYSDIIVGGFSATTMADTSGPDIKLFMNDTLFREGGLTDNNPRLLAIIEDSSGINITGTAVGHDLTGFLDKDNKKSFILNSYFENDFNDFRRGRVTYDLSELTDGSHSITLKAWDNFNNSSEQSLIFLVETEGKFIIRNLINYPNPFFTETNITAEHNRPEKDLTVCIRIYNLNGGLIKMINTKVKPIGYTIPPISWDGNDELGYKTGRGIYPYTVTITSETGETARASGRMIIL